MKLRFLSSLQTKEHTGPFSTFYRLTQYQNEAMSQITILSWRSQAVKGRFKEFSALAWNFLEAECCRYWRRIPCYPQLTNNSIAFDVSPKTFDCSRSCCLSQTTVFWKIRWSTGEAARHSVYLAVSPLDSLLCTSVCCRRWVIWLVLHVKHRFFLERLGGQ